MWRRRKQKEPSFEIHSELEVGIEDRFWILFDFSSPSRPTIVIAVYIRFQLTWESNTLFRKLYPCEAKAFYWC